MKSKKEKRKIKLIGRKICHGNKNPCIDEHNVTADKTPKGTKPNKIKKVWIPKKN